VGGPLEGLAGLAPMLGLCYPCRAANIGETKTMVGDQAGAKSGRRKPTAGVWPLAERIQGRHGHKQSSMQQLVAAVWHWRCFFSALGCCGHLTLRTPCSLPMLPISGRAGWSAVARRQRRGRLNARRSVYVAEHGAGCIAALGRV